MIPCGLSFIAFVTFLTKHSADNKRYPRILAKFSYPLLLGELCADPLWVHRVCNPLFSWYRQNSSHAKAVYNPKAFFLHAASLDQAFAHCRIFSTAATRRCTSRVSVSSLGNTLSRPLPVIALVSRYLTN